MSMLTLFALLIGLCGVCARVGNHGVFDNMSGACAVGEGIKGFKTWFFGGAVRARTWDFKCKRLFDFPNGESCDWKPSKEGYVNEYNGEFNFQCPPGSYIAGVESSWDWWKRDHKYRFMCCSPKTPYTCRPFWGTDTNKGTLGSTFEVVPTDRWTLSGIESDYDHGVGDRNFKFTYSGMECAKFCDCPGIADSAWRVIDVKYDLQAAKKSTAKPVVVHTQTFDNNSGGKGNQRFVVSKTLSRTFSFSHKAGTSVKHGVSFKVGIPGLFDFTGSLEVTGSYDYTWGEDKSVTRAVNSWASIEILPYTRVRLTSKVNEYKLDVPYTITLEREKGCTCESKGIWSGVAITSQNTRSDVIDEHGNVINDKQITGRSLDLMARGTEPECRIGSNGWTCYEPGVEMSEFQAYVYPQSQMGEATKMAGRKAVDCFSECRADTSCAGVVRRAGVGLTQDGDCYSVSVSDLEKCTDAGNTSGFPVVWIERGRQHRCLPLTYA